MMNVIVINEPSFMVIYSPNADVTALISAKLNGQTFKLKGDHSFEYIQVAERGFKACLAYFRAVENRD